MIRTRVTYPCLPIILLLIVITGATAADWKEPPRGVGHWPEEVGTHPPRTRNDGSPTQSLGNHRAVVRVTDRADAVRVRVPWRRRDTDADQKATLLFDAAGDTRIDNIIRVEINREYGDLIFQPAGGPGDYYIYYMPYTYTFLEGSGDYRLTYDAPEDTADDEWLKRNNLTEDRPAADRWKELPRAEVVEIQARTEFDRFDPMEVCATAEEIRAMVARNAGQSYLTFPEDRLHPIRMKDNLPLKWIERGPSTEFRGEACRNEFYPFQIGLFSPARELTEISVEFSDLQHPEGSTIPAAAVRCFNSGGIDAYGQTFTRELSVPQGRVLPLWIGVQVPKDAAPGVYAGTVTLKPGNAEATEVKVFLTVTGQVLEDHGDSELWRHSRLRWLDSTIGIDDDVSAPYTPVAVQGRKVSVLQRDIRFGADGLPESITSKGREILARPISLIAETAEGPVRWQGQGPKLTGHVPARAALETLNTADRIELRCTATTDYDGCVTLNLTLKARADVDLTSLRLEIPYRREVTTYMMGQAQRPRGGLRPQGDTQDVSRLVWLGEVHAGMQVTLPAGTRHIREAGDEVILSNDMGELSLEAGEEREISFQLLITPLKPLDPDHWNWRYFQAWKNAGSPAQAEQDRVKILSVHHASEHNPYINYPFLTTKKLGGFAQDAHDRGIRVKYYYTLRELSNYAVELWAFRAIEPGIFPNRDRRGGYSWLQEHVFDDYDRAWHSWPTNTDITDAAIQTTGNSRLMNYYLEGLYWLTRYLGNDGLYIDGLAFGKDGMRRVRKTLDAAKPRCLVDFHCGRIGSNANLFMSLFPYMDSIWLGEGYDYDDKPDFWLVEVSGIPLGLWGELLGSSNPWRGMLYGMTSRLGWGGDPRPIWRLWDEFGIADAEMIGYWEDNCPVSTQRDDILATAYVKKGKTLISIASWADESVDVRLAIDWAALGLEPGKLYAPEVEHFQEEGTFGPSDAIPTPKGRGWLLIVGQ